MDSILFEDDGELEYFDVLNLLPLSKVRLEFDESDNRNFTPPGRLKRLCGAKENETSSDADGESTVESEQRRTPRILQVSEFSDDNSLQFGSNVTDEDKCKSHTIDEKIFEKSHTDEESWKSFISLSSRSAWDTDSHRESFDTAKDEVEQHLEISERKTENEGSDNLYVEDTENCGSPDGNLPGHQENTSTSVIVGEQGEVSIVRLEEAEDFKSIWISDSEEVEDMSRRPQILTIVDSEVTKKRCWGPTVIGIDDIARDESNEKTLKTHIDVDGNAEQKNEIEKEVNNRL